MRAVEVEAQGPEVTPYRSHGSDRDAAIVQSELLCDQREQTLRMRTQSQVDGLPPSTRQLLLELALCDPAEMFVEFDVNTCRSNNVVAVFWPAMECQLVKAGQSPRTIVFRDPLIRSVVKRASTAKDRRRAHQALAERLDDQSGQRIRHLAASTLEPNEGVANQLAHLASRSARRGDALTAIAAMGHAARISPLRERADRRKIRANYWQLTEIGHASPNCMDWNSGRDPDSSMYAAAVSARLVLKEGGHVETAHGLISRAIRTHGASSRDGGSLIEAVRTLVEICALAGRPDLWELAGETTLAVGSKLPTDVTLFVRAVGCPTSASPSALRSLDQLVRRLYEDADFRQVVRIASVLPSVGPVSASQAALWKIVSAADAGGGAILQLEALANLCFDYFMSGRWDDAEQLAQRGASLCDAADHADMAWLFQYRLGLVAAGRGNGAYCREIGHRMLKWAKPRGYVTVQKAVHHINCAVAIALGDFENAYEQAVAIGPVGEFTSHTPFALFVILDLIEAAIRTGRVSEARSHADGMQRLRLAEISPRLEIAVNASSAMTTPIVGEAAESFEEALRVRGGKASPFDLARVELCYGEHLRRSRKVLEARVHLGEAARAFRMLGATPWVRRAESELRAARGSKSRASVSGVGSLTAQELEIASLAASGLTNKEIGKRTMLSHRTVSAHLYRVFPKLEIKSRAALRDALGGG